MKKALIALTFIFSLASAFQISTALAQGGGGPNNTGRDGDVGNPNNVPHLTGPRSRPAANPNHYPYGSPERQAVTPAPKPNNNSLRLFSGWKR